MKDWLDRTIDYMRISVSPACNQKCIYCKPYNAEGNDSGLKHSEIISYDEIISIVEAAVQLGISKYKLTGGEPLLWEDTAKLVSRMKQINGVESVSLTTNGSLLLDKVEELKCAGIDGINISLDSLDPKEYGYITGSKSLELVLKALDACVHYGINTKINVVTIDRDNALDDFAALVELAKDRPIDVRFIELMPIGNVLGLKPYPHDKLLAYFTELYKDIEEDKVKHGNGPAVYYKLPGFVGSIGFISAIHNKFCANCNRVRLTSDGYLKLCLSYNEGVDLLQPLREGKNIKEIMYQAIFKKPVAHSFEDMQRMTENKSMNFIGG